MDGGGTETRQFPPFRTMKYAIWRACERLGVLPPCVRSEWDTNNDVVMCNIIAYGQLRDWEEDKLRKECLSLPPLK